MNLKVGRVSPLRAVCALPNCGAHGVTRPTGSWSRCMRKKRQGAFHEPPVWCPGFSRSGPPEGGTPNKFRRKVRFLVPMHAKKRKVAFHEPTATNPPLTPPRRGPRRPAPLLGGAGGGFMVPMHAEKTRKGALHKPGSDEPT